MSKVTISYSLMQGSEWALDSCLYCYSSVFLLSCGLSNTFIGIILGFAITLSFLGQIFFGELFNTRGQSALKCFFEIGGFILLVCNFLLLLGLPNWLSILLFIVCCLYIQLFPAFMNSAAMYEIQCGVHINYGAGRGSGSLGYGICTVLMGQLILIYGTPSMFLCGLLLSLLFFVSSRSFFCSSRKERTSEPVDSSAALTRSSNGLRVSFVKKYPRYTIVLLGAALVMAGHTYMSNFIYQIVSSKGGNEASVGIASAIAACCEIPILFLFERIKHRLRCDSWLKLACLLMTFKMLLAFLASTLFLLNLSEILQLGYALFMVSSVYYTSSVIPKEDTINSQAYLNAASTLGVLLSLLSGGLIIDHRGVPALLFTGVLLLCAGSGIIFTAAHYSK